MIAVDYRGKVLSKLVTDHCMPIQHYFIIEGHEGNVEGLNTV